jgi:hypothetical protein
MSITYECYDIRSLLNNDLNSKSKADNEISRRYAKVGEFTDRENAPMRRIGEVVKMFDSTARAYKNVKITSDPKCNSAGGNAFAEPPIILYYMLVETRAFSETILAHMAS